MKEKFDFTFKLHMLHRFYRYRFRTERFDLKHLLQLPISGSAVLDIGTNKGIFAWWMSRCVGINGQVHCFEPQPELFSHLKRLSRVFSLNNVQFYMAGLSSEPGRAQLFRDYIGDGAASLILREKSQAIEIETSSLNKFLASNHEPNLLPITFVKMDVEGFEFEVMRGADRLVKLYRPTFLIECSVSRETDQQIVKILEQDDYLGFFADHEGLHALEKIRQRPYPDREIDHRNVWFCPREKFDSFFHGEVLKR
jgi:FkbM family methyltransferase